MPLVLIVPLLGIATWVTVGRALRPLAALREEVTQRNPGSLTPIALEHAPDEVKPLVGSLNDLLSRLGQALRQPAALHGGRGARAAHPSDRR